MDRPSFSKFYWNEKHQLFDAILLDESFKDAQRVFSQQADPEEVQSVLGDFKNLSQQGKLKGEDKDITKWMNRPFDQLKSTVNIAKQTPSNKEAKKILGKDAKQVYSYGDWVVIVPLTQDASCKYGAGTKWCTAASQSKNYFADYFHDKKVTLLYFINKKTNEKLAVAAYPGSDAKEYFDANDTSLSSTEFLNRAQISEDQFDHVISSLPNMEDREMPKNDAEKREKRKLIQQKLDGFENIINNAINDPDSTRNWDKNTYQELEDKLQAFSAFADSAPDAFRNHDDYGKAYNVTRRLEKLWMTSQSVNRILRLPEGDPRRHHEIEEAKELISGDSGLEKFLGHFLHGGSNGQEKIDQLTKRYNDLINHPSQILNLSDEQISAIENNLSDIESNSLTRGTEKMISKFDTLFNLFRNIKKGKIPNDDWVRRHPELAPVVNYAKNKGA